MKKVIKGFVFVLVGIVIFYVGMKYENKYGNSAIQNKLIQEELISEKCQALSTIGLLKAVYSTSGTDGMRNIIDDIQDQRVVSLWSLSITSPKETQKKIHRHIRAVLPYSKWSRNIPESAETLKLRKEADAILEIVGKERAEEISEKLRKAKEQTTPKKLQRKAVFRSSITNNNMAITNTVVEP